MTHATMQNVALQNSLINTQPPLNQSVTENKKPTFLTNRNVGFLRERGNFYAAFLAGFLVAPLTVIALAVCFTGAALEAIDFSNKFVASSLDCVKISTA